MSGILGSLGSRAWLQLWSNDARGASQTALNAEEASRKADEISRCHQIANTGRCLLEVEQQISRALLLIDEAEVAARTLEIDFVELEWARAHAARWKGDLDRAQRCRTAGSVRTGAGTDARHRHHPAAGRQLRSASPVAGRSSIGRPSVVSRYTSRTSATNEAALNVFVAVNPTSIFHYQRCFMERGVDRMTTFGR